jgi:uncharacterized protein DUF1707/cell wall-active antibiotic response 4TMS protein YvqF
LALLKKAFKNGFIMLSKLEKPINNPHPCASTKDIDDAIHQLQSAFCEGRLNEEDFDKRVTIAINANTREQLLSLLHDLAMPADEIQARRWPTTTMRPLKSTSVAICGGNEHQGPFVLPQNYRIVAVMGGSVLDLRQAHFESAVTDISITAVMGGVDIIIPKNVRVEMQGIPILGGFSSSCGQVHLPANAPVLRIHGIAVMGGVDVRHGDTNHYHRLLET